MQIFCGTLHTLLHFIGWANSYDSEKVLYLDLTLP